MALPVRSALALALALAALSSCSDPQQRAVKRLKKSGYTFAPADFHRAAAEGDQRAVEMFFEAGMAADVPGPQGRTALTHAAEGGRAEVADYLIERGADASAADAAGLRPLHYAVRSGSAPTVRALLAAGADPMAREGAEGEGLFAPLTRAAYEGHGEVVAALAPSSRPFLDKALQVASFKGSVEAVDALLANGASVYARSEEGKTPLMYAASQGNAAVTQSLLDAGANRYALDDDGRTAADIAGVVQHAEVAEMLREPPPARGGPAGPAPPDESALFPAAPVDAAPEPQRLAGAQVPAAPDPAPEPNAPPPLRMRDYREVQLPILLEGVSEDGLARIRLLYGDGADMELLAGDLIGSTGLRVLEAERSFAHRKGGGELVDVSYVTVQDERSPDQPRYRIVRGVAARSNETYALLETPDGAEESIPLRFDARVEDEFSAGGERWRVFEIRPDQVVIRNIQTGRAITIQRDQPGAP